MGWTAVRTWLAGEEPEAAILNQQIRDNLKTFQDAEAAYTPIWGSSGTQPAIGNGSITGAYTQSGVRVDWRVRIVMGSTTTFGTGNYTISLPVTAAQVYNPNGGGHIFDTSAGAVLNIGLVNSTTGVTRLCGTSNFVTPTNPVTFANGDEIVIGGSYAAAVAA